MAFIDSSETLQARLHLGDLSPKKVILILVIFSVSISVIASAIVSSFRTPELTITTETLSDSTNGGNGGLESSSAPSDADLSSLSEDIESSGDLLYVYISGCVNKPGVYALPAGSRVQDALLAAGGLSDDAANGYLNQARLLVDEEHIAVPSDEDLLGFSQGQFAGWMGEQGLVEASSSTSDVVNINTATIDQLVTLDGIGEATARKIVSDRDENGPFSSPENLMRVSGIGEKKFAAIADRITV